MQNPSLKLGNVTWCTTAVWHSIIFPIHKLTKTVLIVFPYQFISIHFPSSQDFQTRDNVWFTIYDYPPIYNNMIKINALKIAFWYEIKNLIIYKINYHTKSVNIAFKRKKNCPGHFYRNTNSLNGRYVNFITY